MNEEIYEEDFLEEKVEDIESNNDNNQDIDDLTNISPVGDEYLTSKTKLGLPSRISDVFCYLINVTFNIFPIYSFYLLFVSDEDEENRLVAWQSVVLCLIFAFISSIVYFFTEGVSIFLSWFIGYDLRLLLGFFSFINGFISFMIIVIMVILSGMALTGRRVKIPLIWNSGKRIIDKIDSIFN